MTEHMRFRTSNIDVEVSYKKAGNKLLVPKPEIIMRADGVVVNQERIVADRKFLWKGKEVKTELTFKDPETGETVKESEVLELLLRYAYRYLSTDGVEVKSKDIQHFSLQPSTFVAGTQFSSGTSMMSDLLKG